MTASGDKCELGRQTLAANHSKQVRWPSNTHFPCLHAVAIIIIIRIVIAAIIFVAFFIIFVCQFTFPAYIEFTSGCPPKLGATELCSSVILVW